MSFTYSGLKTAIQDYTENEETSFVSHLNDFIELTEERILKTVQLDLFKKNVSGTFTSSNQFLTAPTDYLAPFSLSATSSSNKIFFNNLSPSKWSAPLKYTLVNIFLSKKFHLLRTIKK